MFELRKSGERLHKFLVMVTVEVLGDQNEVSLMLNRLMLKVTMLELLNLNRFTAVVTKILRGHYLHPLPQMI